MISHREDLERDIAFRPFQRTLAVAALCAIAVAVGTLMPETTTPSAAAARAASSSGTNTAGSATTPLPTVATAASAP